MLRDAQLSETRVLTFSIAGSGTVSDAHHLFAGPRVDVQVLSVRASPRCNRSRGVGVGGWPTQRGDKGSVVSDSLKEPDPVSGHRDLNRETTCVIGLVIVGPT